MSDRKRIWTVPNVLTMFRLALVPVYWVLMMGYKQNYWALGVFVLAACTDMLDGFLARKYNQITDFGKWADDSYITGHLDSLDFPIKAYN